MEFAVTAFGNQDRFDLSEVTHFYPEWKRHEDKLLAGQRRIPMSLVDFFGDPDPDELAD